MITKLGGFLLLIFFLHSHTSKALDAPKILEVYPTTNEIPVNILRFYIQFSQPMQEMDIYKYVQFKDEFGKELKGVLYRNQQELWNEDRTKVTLIVDPGRVKRGLKANKRLGRAFEEGKRYQLTISQDLLNFADQKLSNSYVKEFLALEEDREAPSEKKWELVIPKKNTNEPLQIYFNDKIDHLSARTWIKVYHEKEEVTGKIELRNGEQEWFLYPKKNWNKGDYKIYIHSSLEDIAANSLNQVFDHKVNKYNLQSKKTGIMEFSVP